MPRVAIGFEWVGTGHLLGERAVKPAVVSWMLSPLQAVHLPITIAEMVFLVVGCVTLMGVSQGVSLL